MPIIRNYGLRWSRNKVQWGRSGKGNKGKLCGKLATIKSSAAVDFRDQIGIYVLYEPGFVPIYVGQAGMGNARLFARLKNHQDDHLRDRWVTFSWFGFRGVRANGTLSEYHKPESHIILKHKDALGEIEGILIQLLEPRLNRQGPKWQQTASEFVQDGLAPPVDRLNYIEAKIDEMQASINLMSNSD